MHQTTKVAIGLGSNLGDRYKVILDAFQHLREDVLEGAQLSCLYETEPWGIVDQPKFLNAVAIGSTEWKPPALLNYFKRLETEIGRVPGPRYGARLIDLDLLVFGNHTWESEDLVVPHPRITERDFVLIPLAEIWPGWVHPMLRLSSLELMMAHLKIRPSTATKIEALPLNIASQ